MDPASAWEDVDWTHFAWDDVGTVAFADGDSVIYRTAYTGDISGLEQSLVGLDDINMPNIRGYTPLQIAIQGNQAEAVRVLLSAGANPGFLSKVNPLSETSLAALDYAAHLGSPDALLALFDHGVEAPVSALSQAAECDNVRCLQIIMDRLKLSKIPEDSIRVEARNALKVAATACRQENVEYLLTQVPGFPDARLEADKHALTNAMLDLLSATRLMSRYEIGYEKNWYTTEDALVHSILEQLITAGAVVDSRAFWMSAKRMVQRDLVRFLLRHGLQINEACEWDESFWREVIHGPRSMLTIIAGDTVDNTSLLEELLAQGADPTVTDRGLVTPLHHAAHPSFAVVLLEYGADMNAIDLQGHTPLYSACYDNRLDVARLLLSRGADAQSIVSVEHWLSLMFSSIDTCWADGSWSRLELAHLLLGHGADVDSAGKDGITVLHKAIEHIDDALVRYLLERGADVHVTTAAGHSVLHTLCSSLEHSEDSVITSLLTKLVDLGSDPNGRDESGATPLHGLVSGQYPLAWKPVLFKGLLKRGADMNLRNNDGKLPSDVLDGSTWVLDAGSLRGVRPGRARPRRRRGRIFCS